jgi:hypothetical protein
MPGNASVLNVNFCYQGLFIKPRTCRGSARNLRSGPFNPEFRGPSIPSVGALLLFSPDALRSSPASISATISSVLRRRPARQRQSWEQPSASHGCRRDYDCRTISTIGMAHTEKNRLDPSFDVERRLVCGGNAGEAHAPVASAVSRPISNPLLLPPFFAPQNA